MADQPHLQLFNPDPNGQNKDPRSFHRFPQLPAELRLNIWRHALQRQRIIHVYLSCGSEKLVNGKLEWFDLEPYAFWPEKPYGAFVEWHQLMNALLHVCKDSRAEGLRFYRAHVPCRFTTRLGGQNIARRMTENTRPGTLYFNPEHDFLHVSYLKETSEREVAHFVDFVIRLKTVHDPRRIGLLNLAMDPRDVRHFLPRKAWLDRNAPLRGPFLETIGQLQEVWLMHTQITGRVSSRELPGHPTSQALQFTRSFPIMPFTPNFELLGPDPRSISQDLKELNVEDPRRSFSDWQEGLRNLGVSLPKGTNYKFLVAYVTSEDEKLDDRAAATRFLIREDKYWGVSEGMTVGPVGLEKAVKPAFGFWLFPVHAFGPFGEDGQPVPEDEMGARKHTDLSAFHPELALSTMR